MQGCRCVITLTGQIETLCTCIEFVDLSGRECAIVQTHFIYGTTKIVICITLSYLERNGIAYITIKYLVGIRLDAIIDEIYFSISFPYNSELFVACPSSKSSVVIYMRTSGTHDNIQTDRIVCVGQSPSGCVGKCTSLVDDASCTT